MPNKRAWAAAALVWICFLSIHCKPQSTRWGGQMETVDGVTVVQNPSGPIDPRATLELREELSIGRDDAGPESLFSDITGLDVSDEGSIYVVDRPEAAIRVFDGDGLYLRTIGRKGQGPGEMEMPVFLRIGPGRELFVFDYSGFRGLSFSLDGLFLRQLASLGAFFPLGRDSTGRIVGAQILAPPPLGGKVLRAYGADLKPRFEIAKEDQGSRAVFDIGKPACFGVIKPDGTIVWGDSKEYVLHLLDPEGRPVRRITKSYDPVPIPDEDRRAISERYADAVRHGLRVEFRSHYPAFGGLFADDEGRLLVKTYERPGSDRTAFYFDVFDPEGRFEARVPIGANLDGYSVWRAGKLYTRETDPEGFPVVKRYKVLWGKGPR